VFNSQELGDGVAYENKADTVGSVGIDSQDIGCSHLYSINSISLLAI